MDYNLGIRLIVIVMGILSAILFTVYILKPRVLEQLCLVNTNECLKIEYQDYKNSVLFHVIPTGYWIWLNGQYLYVFGENTGQICENNEKYQPAYVINPNKNQILGYQCVIKLSDVKTFYDQKSGAKKYIYERISDPYTFNAYDAYNLLLNRGIIRSGI